MSFLTDFDLLTPRLQLTPFTEGEVELFHSINPDQHIRRYLWDNEEISYKVAEDIMSRSALLFQNENYGLWKVIEVSSKEVTGYAGLWFFFDEDQPQLIYAILKPFTGLGYATEAARAIIKYAFNNLKFSYLIASMDKPHRKSQAVAQRLGMHILRQSLKKGKNTIFYIIENPDVVMKTND